MSLFNDHTVVAEVGEGLGQNVKKKSFQFLQMTVVYYTDRAKPLEQEQGPCSPALAQVVWRDLYINVYWDVHLLGKISEADMFSIDRRRLKVTH